MDDATSVEIKFLPLYPAWDNAGMFLGIWIRATLGYRFRNRGRRFAERTFDENVYIRKREECHFYFYPLERVAQLVDLDNVVLDEQTSTTPSASPPGVIWSMRK